jgi:hypothetical protein
VTERRGNDASEAAEAAAEKAVAAAAASQWMIARVEADMADAKRACGVAEANTEAEHSLHAATR